MLSWWIVFSRCFCLFQCVCVLVCIRQRGRIIQKEEANSKCALHCFGSCGRRCSPLVSRSGCFLSEADSNSSSSHSAMEKTLRTTIHSAAANNRESDQKEDIEKNEASGASPEDANLQTYAQISLYNTGATLSRKRQHIMYCVIPSGVISVELLSLVTK